MIGSPFHRLRLRQVKPTVMAQNQRGEGIEQGEPPTAVPSGTVGPKDGD